MRKVVFLTLICLFFFVPLFSSAEEGALTIYLFDDRLCPVCKETKEFLEEVAAGDSEIELITYPVSEVQKLKEVASEHGVENYNIMAPTVFIGNEFFQFRDFNSRSKEMIFSAIKGEHVEKDCCLYTLPFLGIEIDIGNWSLPIITFVLGSIDGFNVCSIGALILVLSIVLIFNSKKKIFFFGGLFIVTTVVIYGLLIFVWGRVFEALVGQLEVLRVIVGLAALLGGVYFFREFLRFYKYGPTCQSSGSKIAGRATENLKISLQNPSRGVFLVALSVIFFATIITIVELPCSVGIPVAFSGILVEANLSLFSYIFYIVLYLFFYMLIELVVFTGAVLTKNIWFMRSGTITWITLVGAVVLFLLAFYYLLS